MTFTEEMDRFFRAFSARDRKTVEKDQIYAQAVREMDAVKACERAIALLPGYGNVNNRRQQQRILKERMLSPSFGAA